MDLLSRLRSMDPNGLYRGDWLIAQLETEIERAAQPQTIMDQTDIGTTWRERLWTVPSETILGIAELCEAVDKPVSWCYKLTAKKGIPHSKLDGSLVFRAGEIRAWIRDHLEVVQAGPMEPPTTDRWLRAS